MNSLETVKLEMSSLFELIQKVSHKDSMIEIPPPYEDFVESESEESSNLVQEIVESTRGSKRTPIMGGKKGSTTDGSKRASQTSGETLRHGSHVMVLGKGNRNRLRGIIWEIDWKQNNATVIITENDNTNQSDYKTGENIVVPLSRLDSNYQ